MLCVLVRAMHAVHVYCACVSVCLSICMSVMLGYMFCDMSSVFRLLRGPRM